ncbi:MAG: insulinase family protein [Bacteroidota bacterium]
MRASLVIWIFILFVNNVFSQEDSSLVKRNTRVVDSLNMLDIPFVVEDQEVYSGSDTSVITDKQFYKLFLNKNYSRPQPPEAEYSSFKLIEAQTFVLTNGIKVILLQNDKLPVVSYKMYFDYNKIFLGSKKGVDLIFRDLWGKSSRSYKENEISEYIDFTAGKLELAEKSIYLEGLEKYKEKNLLLLSDMTLGFKVSDSQFLNSKRKIIDSLKHVEYQNKYISKSVGRNLMFGNNHPVGEFIQISEVDSLSKFDLYDYYNSYYKPNNSYLVVYGDISLRELKRIVNRNFRKYRKGNVINGYYPQPYNIHQTEIDFIENYDSDELSVWMGNVDKLDTYDSNWILGRIGNFILLDEEEGLFRNELVENNTVSNFGYHLRDQGAYFSVTYNAKQDSVATSIEKSLEVVNSVLDDKVPEGVDLKSIESKIIDNYINGLSDPQKISDLYLLYYLTGLDKYLVKNLMSVIDTVDFSTVSNVLSNRVKPNKMRVVVSGPPQVAVPQLEKLGYPIIYYDKYAKETFPPSLDRSVPDSVDVNYVLQRYIKVIGGDENLKNIKKLWQWWVMDINNSKLFVKNKYMLPNKRLSTYSNNEVIVLKTVFNGEYGYVERSGEKQNILGEEFMKLSLEKSIFPIMYYQEDGYLMTLESQIPLKGELCYKIRVESPVGEVSLLYFRVSDGYLIKRESIDVKTNKVNNYLDYSDFKTYDNVVFPYKVETLIGGKKSVLTLTQIKINDENVRKRNFK